MIDNLIIQSTDDTPYVEFDIQKNIFCIKGKSLPEVAMDFYADIIEWFTQFKMACKNKEITIDFNLEYLNTSSEKQIAKLLLEVQESVKVGNKIKVRWFYYKDDDDMKQSGLRFFRLMKLDFELISYSD